MKKSLLLSLALSINCFGFADWVTEAVPITSAPISATPDYQNTHDSHASDNGTLHLAYVLRENNQDKLYYLKKSLYQNPGRFASTIQPVLIDTATRITSVQVRYAPGFVTAHFVYNRFAPLPSTGDISVNSLHHSLYQPWATEPIVRQSISTRLGDPFEVSLETTIPPSERVSRIGIAYYNPVSNSQGTLSYAMWEDNNTWTTAVVDDSPNTIVGRNPDLAFATNGEPCIAYENGTSFEIQYASRNTNGTWGISTVAGPSERGAASDPVLLLDSDGRHIVYVQQNGANRRLVLNNRRRAGLEFITTISTVDFQSNPDDTIFARTFFNPKLVISQKRVVVSYKKSSSIVTSDPMVAARRSDKITFETPLALPRLSGDSANSVGETQMTLDRLGYPIISWLATDDRGLRATYCPDWTDRDRDGVNHLQEKAFAMNPSVPDIQRYPKPRIVNVINSGRHLALRFNLPADGMINSATEQLETELFRYSPELTTALRKWDYENGEATWSVLNPGPPFGSSATLQCNTPLGDPSKPKDFMRMAIFRK